MMVVVVCEDTNNGWKFSGVQVSYPLPVSPQAILNNNGWRVRRPIIKKLS